MLGSLRTIGVAAAIGVLASGCTSSTESSGAGGTSTGGGMNGSGAQGSGQGGAGHTGGGGGAGGSPGWLQQQGKPCPAAGCPAPLMCVTYCGLGGCGGSGELNSCEIPCDPANSTCPNGQTCVNISDGPGNVCSP